MDKIQETILENQKTILCSLAGLKTNNSKLAEDIGLRIIATIDALVSEREE